MPELFAIDVQDMIRECERELEMRKRVYPRRVANNLMKQDQADRQIAVMQAVIDHLRSTMAGAPRSTG